MENNFEHLKINRNTELESKREQLAILDAKHVSKTRYERLKPLATATRWFCNLFQFNSFFLAALGGCAYLWFEMGTQGIPFMILVVAFFGGLEWVVHKALKTYGAMRFDDNVISPVIYVFMLVSLSASTPSTLFLTPYSIRLVTPSPVMIDTAQIAKKQNILIKTDTSYWASREEKARNEAFNYKQLATRTNSRTGITKLRSRSTKTYNSLLANIDSMSVKKDIALHEGKARKEAAITGAVIANKERMNNYLAWCSQFGWILAGVSALSILLLIPFRLFYEWWERYYAKDLRGSIKIKEHNNPQVTEQVREETVGDKGDDKEEVTDNQESESIQFAYASSKEGDIIKGEGRKADRVLVEVAGELREMTRGQLNRLIKGQTGLDRIKHLTNLKNKLR